MSAKAISEQTGKEFLYKYICTSAAVQNRFKYANVTAETDWDRLAQDHPWLLTEHLVVKPDQLIKRRGKLGLVGVNLDLQGVKEWLKPRLNRETTVAKAKGVLKNFLIEPFVAHKQEEEFYICIYATREGDHVLFHHEGGVDVGDVDAKAQKFLVAVDEKLTEDDVKKHLLPHVSADKKDVLASFILGLFNLYEDLYFTYLEINPLVVTGEGVFVLDMAAKIDATADYICKAKWGDVEFPPPFGREAYPEEAYIADLDAKSGASLKLTLLNPRGRIWTMVAGGGASVVYSDTICDLGGVNELANYGEYSGAPSEQQTYDYAKTILSLMTREKHNDGKVLIIGGSIANFTNVAATFKGIVRAIKDYQVPLKEHEVTIFVRRGGPNYQEGLRVMGEVGKTTGIPIHVFGTETHMTAIVGMALGHRPIPNQPPVAAHTANFLLNSSGSASVGNKKVHYNDTIGGTDLDEVTHERPRSLYTTHCPTWSLKNCSQRAFQGTISPSSSLCLPLCISLSLAPSCTCCVVLPKATSLFSKHTKSLVWGMQTRAVQGMLDFDYICSREEPSVAALVYPFTGDHKQKFYWGHKEILIPVYKNMSDAMKKHPEVDVLISFASLRSAFDSTMETMQYPQIHTIAIIAEGIPEAQTRKIIKTADEKGVTIIGPATVGGIKPGCFKIGNTGGMLDNILASKLYRPGSVAYVSRSGGMSNELNNIISRTTDGVFEGVAIGGDRYPGSTFMDHVLRYQDTPGVKMIVMLGEIGGAEEYKICQGIKEGRITKPVVCWCIGTCATMFSSEVQFGHAGACANQASETAVAKNQALREAGAIVPRSFDELGDAIKTVCVDLVASGVIVPAQEVPPPTVPMDYSWARELGLIRKPASFMTSICDERGQELIYAGMPITEVFKEEMGLGGVLGLLWFQRRLPRYACQFIEMCLMVTADHGPAVSGAHNTIVCARAGKDLISSLTSGLLTIGDRFGGALDAAARQFSKAFDSGLMPMEFVNKMKKEGKLIMGIGHRVKSINNPDMRVQILKDFVKQHFPATQLLDYALDVEKITTSKASWIAHHGIFLFQKPNLILNVDGFIGVAFVDLLRTCGGFTREEADEYVEIGALNGIFVLGRSMGFIGHYLDQKRLKQGLYRHPWDDISYVLPEHMTM
ncbi:ACLY synthase, partial [Amia calva]|nr:ACLY synthase [Amia calva]